APRRRLALAARAPRRARAAPARAAAPRRRPPSRRPAGALRVKLYESRVDAAALRFGVVVSRFNHLVSVRLLEACTTELSRRRAASEDVHVAWVPGAYELPLAARALATSGRYDAIVALGVVIRGGTPHFEFVCRGVTDGVQAVMRDTGVPVAFG